MECIIREKKIYSFRHSLMYEKWKYLIKYGELDFIKKVLRRQPSRNLGDLNLINLACKYERYDLMPYILKITRPVFFGLKRFDEKMKLIILQSKYAHIQ